MPTLASEGSSRADAVRPVQPLVLSWSVNAVQAAAVTASFGPSGFCCRGWRRRGRWRRLRCSCRRCCRCNWIYARSGRRAGPSFLGYFLDQAQGGAPGQGLGARRVKPHGHLHADVGVLQGLSAVDLDSADELITYCTIGGRACTAWFVLTYLLGRESVRVYDGSWAEWGRMADAPVEQPCS